MLKMIGFVIVACSFLGACSGGATKSSESGDSSSSSFENCVSTQGGANTFTDCRDGRAYRTAVVGGNSWLMENLNFKPAMGNTWCYENKVANCDVYGRLYDWDAAMVACPVGWHLADTTEWIAAAPISSDGSALNLKHSGRYFMATFTFLGEFGSYWTSTPNGEDKANLVLFGNIVQILDYYGRSPGMAVRCVQDLK